MKKSRFLLVVLLSLGCSLALAKDNTCEKLLNDDLVCFLAWSVYQDELDRPKYSYWLVFDDPLLADIVIRKNLDYVEKKRLNGTVGNVDPILLKSDGEIETDPCVKRLWLTQKAATPRRYLVFAEMGDMTDKGNDITALLDQQRQHILWTSMAESKNNELSWFYSFESLKQLDPGTPIIWGNEEKGTSVGKVPPRDLSKLACNCTVNSDHEAECK